VGEKKENHASYEKEEREMGIFIVLWDIINIYI
jgi:hypothetical protein